MHPTVRNVVLSLVGQSGGALPDPPAGSADLIDSNVAFIVDDNGAYLIAQVTP